MTDHDDVPVGPTARLDRPSAMVPSVDNPARDAPGPEARRTVRHRDQSRHRVFHNLYEDMLN